MKSSVSALALFLVLGVASAVAGADEGRYWQPQVGIGTNSQQGTSISLGVDFGYRFDPNWSAGVGAHYAFGNQPSLDREYGFGPFVGYAMGLNEYVILHARQEISQLDVRNPYDPKPATGPEYESEKGAASITSAGATLRLGNNLAISVGYRVVLGLGNSDLGEGRSGPVFGLGIGF